MTTVVVMHHPLFTVTPRAFNYKGDAKLYETEEELKEVLELLHLPPDCVIYNEIIRRIFEEEKLVFDLIVCAHDHCNYYYNNLLDPNASYKICQVTAGGGGGDLQDMMNFKEHHNIGGFLKYHGFVSLTFNKYQPGLIIIEIFTTEGHHLKFTNKSPNPIRDISTDKRVERLHDVIVSACHQYQDFLNEKQIHHSGKFFWPTDNLYRHKLIDVHIMHDMLNYVNRPKPSDFDTTVDTLYGLIKKIYNKNSKHSLFLYIKKKLEEEEMIGHDVLKHFADLEVSERLNNNNNDKNDKKSAFTPM